MAQSPVDTNIPIIAELGTIAPQYSVNQLVKRQESVGQSLLAYGAQ
jgi:hypothetical protein